MTPCQCYLPPEIWLEIIQYLPGTQRIKLRLVSQWFKNLVDSYSDRVWKKLCLSELRYVDVERNHYASLDTRWFHIYRSIIVWPQVRRCKYQIKILFVEDELVHSVTMIENAICINCLNNITIISLKDPHRHSYKTIRGPYLKYHQYKQVIIALDICAVLHVVRNNLVHCSQVRRAKFLDVKTFIVKSGILYYLTNTQVLYTVNLQSKDLISVELAQIPIRADVCHIVFTDNLIMVTDANLAYIWTGKELQEYPLSERLEEILQECTSPRMVWSYTTAVWAKSGILVANITALKIYQGLFIVGTYLGKLYICKPNSEPIKQWDLSGKGAKSSILYINVIENRYGHMLIVGQLNRVIAINLYYKFRNF